MLESLYPRLTKELTALLKGLSEKEIGALEEIRIYLGQNTELIAAGRRIQTDLRMDEERMDQLLCSLSGFALYRFENQMAEGYIPLPGGHRAGVCGTMVRQMDGNWRMNSVTSICLRIARSVDGASSGIHGHLFTAGGRVRRVLLLGEPGCGKTTVLRDAALHLARRVRVAVADEREELFAQGMVPLKGVHIDVLRGTDKARAFSMLIRSMAPQVIVCDELGREADVQAMLDAARCGVGVLASAHANGLQDLMKRPVLRSLFDAGAFERYIHLGRHGSVMSVWDGDGNRLKGEEGMGHGELGGRGDGDDRRKQRRISLV